MREPKLTWAVLLSVAVAACGGDKQTRTVPPSALDRPAAAAEPARPPPAAAEAPVAKGNPRDDLIPRTVLFGNPERVNVQLSPDGKYVSWLAPSNGVLNVFVAPAGKLDQARPVTTEKARPIQRYTWTYDGKHLLYPQDQAGNENFHVYRVDVTSGELKDLTPYEGARTDILAVSPLRPKAAVIQINDRDRKVFDVYRIDLATGERTLLVQNDQELIDFGIDRNLEVRLATKMLPDGGWAWLRRDPKNKKIPWKQLLTIGPDDAVGSRIFGFDKRGRTVYVADSRGRDTAALYALDVRSGKKKLVFEDAKSDVDKDEKVQLEPVLFHPSQFTLQAVQINWDKPRWVAIDKKIQKDLDGIAKLGEGTPNIVSRSLDDRTWIVELVGDRAAPRYFKWDHKAQKGEFLFSARPALDEQPLVPMQPVVIKSRDGLDLVSYLTLPKGADADGDGKPDKPVPMVLLVHGGPWDRDRWGYRSGPQLLANRGYAVLSVNYRGSTGFGKKFINAAKMQWGKQMHDDLLDAVDWAVKNGVAPKDKICIMGGSFGGYETLVGLSMTPDVFACGVDIVGFSNVLTFIETVPPYWQPIVMPIMRAKVGDPSTEEGKKALLEVSPLTHAANIKRPLLIAHGANDPRVNKAESDQIVKAMQAKNIPVSYVVFTDEGHGLARPENMIAFFALTEAFLSVHLGGSYQPITDAELKASSMTIEAGKQWLPGLPGGAAGKQVSAR